MYPSSYALSKVTVTLLIFATILGGVVFFFRNNAISPINSRGAIGSINLEHLGDNLQARFIAPKNLDSLTLVLSKNVSGSQEFGERPDFSCTVRVHVADNEGLEVLNKSITNERMKWTNWHDKPSLMLILGGWLGERLKSGQEYTLTVTVESAMNGLGIATAYLHWIDGRYLWGSDLQELRIVSTSATDNTNR